MITLQASYAQLCNPADTSQCGQTIATPGHGAVELCQDCFYCGDGTDGVCPEDFSDGTPETDANKRIMMLRVGTDRPIIGSNPDANPVIFANADAACASMVGTCSGPGAIETKSSLEGTTWSSPGSISCNTPMAGRSDYVRVTCDIPKAGNCQECPDPDCTSSVRGITFDNSSSKNLINTHVNIVSTNNVNIRAEADSNGVYTMSAFRGRVRVVCTALDYQKFEQQIYLKKGDNVVDCRMAQATCQPTCTLPDINGNNICRASCDGQNGCNFASSTTMSICQDVPEGSTIVLKRQVDGSGNPTDFVEAVTCCTGAITLLYRPLLSISSNDITNLLTRDYRKKLNGLPVTIRVITYNKN